MVSVIIPSLNPDRSLINYVKKIIQNDLKPVVIINDGSSCAYDNIFNDLADIEDCVVLSHEVNRGKGAALKTACRYFIENYPNHKGIITADADGQHAISDIIKIAEIIKQGGSRKAILGQRDLYNKNVPFRSRIGNATSALLFSILYGCNIWDTQSGLRGFTSDLLKSMINIKGDRYDYEMNVLAYLRINNIDIVKIPIKTIYINDNKGSHFRTFYDTSIIFIRILGSFFAYISKYITSILTDIFIFALCFYVFFIDVELAQKVLIATIIARIGSSIVNYIINHKKISTHDIPPKNKVIKYYIFWLAQLIVSYFAVLEFSLTEKVNIVFIKLVVDLLISTISYQIQKRLDFKKKTLKYQ